MALKIGLSGIGRGDTQAKVAEMQTVADELIQSVRQLAAELRPAVLDALGLAEALRWQARESRKTLGIPIQCELAEITVDPEVATVAFRFMQEALSNVGRHAQASEARMQLKPRGDAFDLELSDNGRGFQPEEAGADCLGLLDMQERLASVGGELTIDSRPGGGTRLTATLPMKGAAS